MLSAPTIERIIFFPFELDLASGRLLHGSEPLALPPKGIAVLRYLAERPGRLATKQELLDDVWPNVYVGEQVLKVQIAEIRKALNDTCRKPRFIETAHRRGYRFIGKVKAVPTAIPQAIPATRYARNGNVRIAYQVLGEGPTDIVLALGRFSHIEHLWTQPAFAHYLTRLAEFSRVILFDARGTGLSDRLAPDFVPALQQRSEDVRSVMDYAGSNRAIVCGLSEGAADAALFAATYPDRTTGLILIGATAQATCDANHWSAIANHWGEAVGIQDQAPSFASNAEFCRWWSAYLRTAASPSAALTLTKEFCDTDLRDILPQISVPTLVLHRTGDRCVSVEEARYIANTIPGARLTQLPGDDHLPFLGDQQAITEEMRRFMEAVHETQAHLPGETTILAASIASSHRMLPSIANPWRRFQEHVARELAWFQGSKLQSEDHFLLASFAEPDKAIHCASAIAFYASRFGLQFTAGIHTGEAPAAALSTRDADTARQIEEHAGLGEILVSEQVRDLTAGAGLRFQQKTSLPASDGSYIELMQLMNRRVAARTQCA